MIQLDLIQLDLNQLDLNQLDLHQLDLNQLDLNQFANSGPTGAVLRVSLSRSSLADVRSVQSRPEYVRQVDRPADTRGQQGAARQHHLPVVLGGTLA